LGEIAGFLETVRAKIVTRVKYDLLLRVSHCEQVDNPFFAFVWVLERFVLLFNWRFCPLPD
jgi:hypothetical protein